MTNMFMKLLSAKLFQKNIIDKAHETILLIDSSKFYKTGFFKINPSPNTQPLFLTPCQIKNY